MASRLVELDLARDGVTVVDGLLDASTCDALAAVLAGRRWPAIPPDLVAFLVDGRWAAVTRAHLGPDVRFFREQLVTKPPRSEACVPWHQDAGYAPIDGELLTWFVALEEIRVHDGCLRFAPGSHEQGRLPHHRVGAWHEVDGAADLGDGEPVELARGSAAVFSSRTLHRSGPNAGDGVRPAWMVQFCRTDAVDPLPADSPHRRGCPVVADATGWLGHLRFPPPSVRE